MLAISCADLAIARLELLTYGTVWWGGLTYRHRVIVIVIIIIEGLHAVQEMKLDVINAISFISLVCRFDV